MRYQGLALQNETAVLCWKVIIFVQTGFLFQLNSMDDHIDM